MQAGALTEVNLVLIVVTVNVNIAVSIIEIIVSYTIRGVTSARNPSALRLLNESENTNVPKLVLIVAKRKQPYFDLTM